MGNIMDRFDEGPAAKMGQNPGKAEYWEGSPQKGGLSSSTSSSTSESSEDEEAISELDEDGKRERVEMWLADVMRLTQEALEKKRGWKTEGDWKLERDEENGRRGGLAASDGDGCFKINGKDVLRLEKQKGIRSSQGAGGKESEIERRKDNWEGGQPTSVRKGEKGIRAEVDLQKDERRRETLSKDVAEKGRRYTEEDARRVTRKEEIEMTLLKSGRRAENVSAYMTVTSSRGETTACLRGRVEPAQNRPSKTGTTSKTRTARFEGEDRQKQPARPEKTIQPRPGSPRKASAATVQKMTALDSARRSEPILKSRIGSAVGSRLASAHRVGDVTVDGHEGDERVEFVVEETEKLMNRENRPMGDCLPEGGALREGRAMRSYEYRRELPVHSCLPTWSAETGRRTRRLDESECPGPSSCQHCSSKLSFLRC